MYTLMLLAILNSNVALPGTKVNLTEEQCITLGEKMEKDVARITEGRGKLLWKCINGSEKDL